MSQDDALNRSKTEAVAIAADTSPTGPTQSLSPGQAGAQITRHDYSWSAALGAAPANPISFGFRTSAPGYNDLQEKRDIVGTFAPLNPAQEAAARTAFSLWSSIANIQFTDLGETNGAAIEIANYYSDSDGSSGATFPITTKSQAPGASDGDVYLNLHQGGTTTPSVGSYAFKTIMHEIGHALGLEHPGDYDANQGRTIDYFTDATYKEDTEQYTVMSYFDGFYSGASYYAYPSAPMLDDIQAIQRLYGPNLNTRVGNTTYGFNTTADFGDLRSIYDFSLNRAPIYCIYDAGGINTLDCSKYGGSQTIDLESGSFSSVLGMIDNISISIYSHVQNAIGGSGNDTIISGGTGCRMTGGGGANTFAGTAAHLDGNVVFDFKYGDTIHLYDVAYVPYGTPITTAGPTVAIPTFDASTHKLSLYPFGPTIYVYGNLTGYSFIARGDGSIGSVITLSTTPDQQPISPPPAQPTPFGLSADADGGVVGDGITNDATPTFIGKGGSFGDTIRLYEGKALVGSGAVGFVGIWSATTVSLADGSHILTAVEFGADGRASPASTAFKVTIDTKAPARPSAPMLPASYDTGLSSTDGITNRTSLVFTGTAEAQSTVTLFDGTTKVGSAVATSTGAYTISIVGVADGAHSLTVTSTDLAGNVSEPSNSTTVIVDTTAVTAPSTQKVTAGATPAGSILPTGSITNVPIVTVTGTADVGSTVTLYLDQGVAVGSAVVGSSGSYTITTPALADGRHILYALATDAAGTRSKASAVNYVTIDTSAPSKPTAPTLTAASDTGFSSTDGITRIKTPVFTGNAEAGSTVTLYEGKTTLGTAVSSPTGTYSITSSALADGIHTLSVTATDKAGNISATSFTANVKIDTMAPAAASAPALKTVSDTGASSTDGITNVKTPTFTGTSEAGSTVTLYDGTTVIGTGKSDQYGVYTIASSALAEGTHRVYAIAADAAGNAAPASPSKTILIDTAVPVAPTLTLAASSDTGKIGDSITGDDTPTYTGAGEAGSTISLYSDNAVLIGTATADGHGTFSITAPTLKDGIHQIYALASDTAGNRSGLSPIRKDTIDTAAPSVSINGSGGNVSSANQTIAGTGEAGTTVTLKNNGSAIGTAVTVGSNGSWSETVALSAGSNSIVATDVDKAGNAGTSQAVNYQYSPATAMHFASLHSMVQAMSTMTPTSSASITPTAGAATQEAHPLAAAHG